MTATTEFTMMTAIREAKEATAAAATAEADTKEADTVVATKEVLAVVMASAELATMTSKVKELCLVSQNKILTSRDRIQPWSTREPHVRRLQQYARPRSRWRSWRLLPQRRPQQLARHLLLDYGSHH